MRELKLSLQSKSILHFITVVKPPNSAKPLSPEIARLDKYFQRIGVRTESVRRLARVALAVAGPGGHITERQLRDLTGYALSTVRLGCKRLVGLKVFEPVPKPKGRGYLKAYRVIWGQKHQNPHQTSDFSKSRRTKTLKSLKTLNKKQSKDPKGQGGGQVRERRESSAYQGLEATRVILVLGARFYRQAMRETRLGLERWELPEPTRHALEGFIGLRLDGMALADARELVGRIWAMRGEIERLARSGASPKRVCSFVAGKLAGVPERSKREVLRRTAELVRQSVNVELIERRITGLKRFESERETEYLSGQVCKRCGYRHSEIEYRSGYRADGTGTLSCFGWVRVKLDELQETRKLSEKRRRERHCRQCEGSLRDGHVEGYCWSCWQKLSAYSKRAKLAQRDEVAPVKSSEWFTVLGGDLCPSP